MGNRNKSKNNNGDDQKMTSTKKNTDKQQEKTMIEKITKDKGGLCPARRPSISFLVLKLICYL